MGHEEGYRRIRGDHGVPAPKRLETWAEAYLALRESLGFQTVEHRKNLRRLVRCLHEHGLRCFEDLDRPRAAQFLHAGSPQEMTVIVRLACLRGFFRYLLGLGAVRQNVWDTFTNPRPKLFVPHIFPEDELRAILERCRSKIDPERPARSHIHAAYSTLFHTIYACGLRTSEACGLDIGDFDADRSLLVIRNSKFGKSRLLPFNARTKELVTEYLRRYRPADDGMAPGAPLFLSLWRRRFRMKTVSGHFHRVCQEAGVHRPKRVEGKTVFGGTTTHALRHSFAVHRLLKWYRDGADVQVKLPLLATYMGHVHYRHTQRYLTVLPTLIDIAGARFSKKFERPLKELE